MSNGAKPGDKEMTEKYILMQILQQNLENMRKQQQILENQYMEVKSTTNSLEEIKKMDKGSDVLIPLGSGCFARGKITDRKEFLTDVGAGIVLDKDTKGINELLGERLKEIENSIAENQTQMETIAERVNKITSEIQSMIPKNKD